MAVCGRHRAAQETTFFDVIAPSHGRSSWNWTSPRLSSTASTRT